MPGYTIKGFSYHVFEEPILHPRVLKRRVSGLGWKDGDALHCRTRAMWDPQMLYIAFSKQANKVADGYQFEANIIDYSNSGLVRGEIQLLWRKKGEEAWNKVLMKETKKDNYYKAKIEGLDFVGAVEYYITAQTTKGQTQTKPMTAPEGFYVFIAK